MTTVMADHTASDFRLEALNSSVKEPSTRPQCADQTGCTCAFTTLHKVRAHNPQTRTEHIHTCPPPPSSPPQQPPRPPTSCHGPLASQAVGPHIVTPWTLPADQRAAHFTHTPFVWERRHSEDFGATSQSSGAPHTSFFLVQICTRSGGGWIRNNSRAQAEGNVDGIWRECWKSAIPPRTHSCLQS